MKESLIVLFNRDLNKLKKELEAYSNESNLWVIDKNISNSAGNLCLHLVGNLRHFIGNQLGNNGYIRVREEEFAQKNIPRTALLSMIDKTIADIPSQTSVRQPCALAWWHSAYNLHQFPILCCLHQVTFKISVPLGKPQTINLNPNSMPAS